MSIRERQLVSMTYSSGNSSRQQLPRDAVYHLLRFACNAGTFATVQGAMGTGPALVPGFPFTLIRQLRVIRNGSDIVASVSGKQLAKHHFFQNNAHPYARLYTTTSNVETLRTATVRGLTLPANAQGIGSNQGAFTVPDAPNATGTVSFDFQADLLFQVGVEDDYYATLLDARPLADYAVEIDWSTEAAQIATAGTANTSSAAAMTLTVLSVDQDNVKNGVPYGTFKRSQISYSNIPYGSQNNQILLPRGNLLYSLMFGTEAFKAGSTVNTIAENAVLDLIELRINTNFSLKKMTFKQFQANNVADNGGRQSAFDFACNGPQGFASISLHNATESLKETIPTYAFDILDLQVSTSALASSQNGVTTASTNPVIDLLIQEIIPGVSMGSSGPQGSVNGSTSRTSAQPMRG